MWRLTLRSPLALVALLALTLTLVACSGSRPATGPTTATLIVTISTTGRNLDPDGYTLSVDGGKGIAVGLNATDTLRDLSSGIHEVRLAGVQTNCDGPVSQQVSLDVGSPGSLAIDVTCKAAFVDQIAFATDRDGQEEIYVMDPDGTHQAAVMMWPSSMPGNNEEPAIRYDGTAIAFIHDGGGNRHIWVMGADSSVNELTYDPGNDYSPTWPDPNFAAWDYGPFGIAFASDRSGSGPNLDIYVMDAVGSPIRITDDSLAFDGEPAWSPDASKIAFTSTRDGNYEIYVMKADGSNQVDLSGNAASDRYAAWSPDGSKIAFVSDRGGTEDIWVMNADGSSPVRLTSGSGAEIAPSWSPDGSRIAFQGDRNGVPDIWVMNADGSNQVDLTNNPARDTHPFWSPVH